MSSLGAGRAHLFSGASESALAVAVAPVDPPVVSRTRGRLLLRVAARGRRTGRERAADGGALTARRGGVIGGGEPSAALSVHCPPSTVHPNVLPVYDATRYVVPLREGGSLPAILDTDGGLFVVKFRGAGQGARALVAELVVGELAARLGLTVPEIALVRLDDAFGRAEPDPEIQDILNGSRGLNVGLRYLDGAFGFDALAVGDLVPPDEAAAVVWLDALTTNVDRTPRNPNLLWAGTPEAPPRLHLIDHGAALYFHHDWPGLTDEKARAPFAPVQDHVLLPLATDLMEADARLAPRLTENALREVLDAIPDALLMDAPAGRLPPFERAESNRAAYLRYFGLRLEAPRRWAEAAEAARRALTPPEPLDYRR